MIPTYLSSQHQALIRRDVQYARAQATNRGAQLGLGDPQAIQRSGKWLSQVLNASPAHGCAYPQGWARGNDTISAGIALISGDAAIARGPLLIMILETIPDRLIY